MGHKTFRNGDLIEYDGTTESHYGATWYGFHWLDGHRRGERGLTEKPPKFEITADAEAGPCSVAEDFGGD